MNNKLNRYEKIKFIGEGQFATVYKSRDVETNKFVAIKMIKLGSMTELKDGVNRTALREIKFLRDLNHPNIISMLDIQGRGSNVSIVFDYMDTDLEVIIKDPKIVFTAGTIKAYTLMTFQGLEYLHSHWIMHRDLKPNNLLVNIHGVLKIADFGLTKRYASPDKVHSHVVVTRWYRCPELLFGTRYYGGEIDMWSMGCIIAELLLKVPFLQGDSDLDQLTKIFQTLGTPNEESWPGMALLQDFIKFKPFPGIPLTQIFTAASDDLIELLSGLLVINPQNRWNCTQALKSAYFSNHPPPTQSQYLPIPESVLQTIEEDEKFISAKRKTTESKENEDTSITTTSSTTEQDLQPSQSRKRKLIEQKEGRGFKVRKLLFD